MTTPLQLQCLLLHVTSDFAIKKYVDNSVGDIGYSEAEKSSADQRAGEQPEISTDEGEADIGDQNEHSKRGDDENCYVEL